MTEHRRARDGSVHFPARSSAQGRRRLGLALPAQANTPPTGGGLNRRRLVGQSRARRGGPTPCPACRRALGQRRRSALAPGPGGHRHPLLEVRLERRCKIRREITPSRWKGTAKRGIQLPSQRRRNRYYSWAARACARSEQHQASRWHRSTIASQAERAASGLSSRPLGWRSAWKGQVTMRRTVWDDLREDARRFSRQYAETGHTLLHVPERDADGAPEIDVERPRVAIGGRP